MAKKWFMLLLLAVAVFAGCKKEESTAAKKTITPIVPVPPADTSCNGSGEYCGKRYDQVVYVTTHNSYNYRIGPNPYMIPNQTYAVDKQLQDGVRGLMLDVYYDTAAANRGQIVMYHGFPGLGKESLLTSMQYIKTFLDAHPREIVTIIFECYVNGSGIDSVVKQAGLTGYLDNQTVTAPWPTLQQMIDANHRLVIFSDKRDAAYPWYHYCWDYAVETGFENHDTTDFSCNYNRGNASNKLFILNHFITNALVGTGDSSVARIANTNPYFLNRALRCMNSTGKLPNFLTVDFYDIGNVFQVADSLNRIVR